MIFQARLRQPLGVLGRLLPHGFRLGIHGQQRSRAAARHRSELCALRAAEMFVAAARCVELAVLDRVCSSRREVRRPSHPSLCRSEGS